MQQSGRRFISDKGDEGGSIRWFLSTSGAFMFDLESSLIITDCTRSITLDFSVYSDDYSVKDRVAKLDSLIEGLEEFRTALKGCIVEPKKYYY